MNVGEMVKRLTPILRGWINYFRVANCEEMGSELMEWVRGRRMKRMRESKTWKALHKAVRRRGYKGEFEEIPIQYLNGSSEHLV